MGRSSTTFSSNRWGRALVVATLTFLTAACAPARLSASESPPEDFKSRVERVMDGDTLSFRVDGRRVVVRLYGIDCPESRQESGPEATGFVRRFVADEMLRVEAAYYDQYGRVVGRVLKGEQCLNEALVAAGYAWVWDRYCTRASLCDEWRRLESKARREGRGLWAHPHPVAPWRWRRLNPRR